MLYAIIAAIILIGDQWLKFWVTVNITLDTGEAALIPGVIKLVNIHNSGAAFGFLGDASYARWLFLGVAALFIIVIIVVLAKHMFKSRFANWCAVMALAGAVGNCIDRALYGYVVDMFKLEFMDFAVFNVADVFLVVACFAFIVYLIVDIFKGDRDEDEEEEEEEEPKPKRPARRAERLSDDDYSVAGFRTGAPEFPDTATPLVSDDRSTDSSEDFWASFKSELRSEAPAKPAARPAAKPRVAPQQPKARPAQQPKSRPASAPASRPKARPKADEYDLESILAEFRDL